MKHYIKTGRGVTEQLLMVSKGGSIEGSGQGAGTSIGNLQGHNDAMIPTFEKHCHPCSTASSPLRTDTIWLWIISFVDDNKLMMNFGAVTPVSCQDGDQ